MTIVKVQIPLFSTGKRPGALIYTISRQRMVQQPISEEVLVALGDDKKGYFEAEWQEARRHWSIGRRVEDESW